MVSILCLVTLTTRIFSASARSVAASRVRRAALISFIACMCKLSRSETLVSPFSRSCPVAGMREGLHNTVITYWVYICHKRFQNVESKLLHRGVKFCLDCLIDDKQSDRNAVRKQTCAISSFCSNTSSNSILGTEARTTARKHISKC